MKKILILTLILSALIFSQTKVKQENLSPSWQQSEALNIQLGVRDKNSSLETYEAVFTAENKAEKIILESRIKVEKDGWGFVYFPNDFPGGAKDGDYQWKCTVGGKKVSSGRFKYAENQRTLTIPKK